MKVFFDLSTSNRCPVCYDVLLQNELVRCVIRSYDNDSEKLRFVKLTRKGGLCVCSRHETCELVPSSNEESVYTRFSITDSQFVADVCQSELNALGTQLKVYRESNIEDRVCYVRNAKLGFSAKNTSTDCQKCPSRLCHNICSAQNGNCIDK